ncbi:MAG: hypothetical protein ACP5NA_05215 [Candidatus Acidulodesulfobacterium sp.]
MIDTVELQQIITNLPQIEKTAASSHILAANSNAITQKEMEIVDETKLNTVVELSETLEAVNDKEKEKKRGNKEKEMNDENETESEDGKEHIDIVA